MLLVTGAFNAIAQPDPMDYYGKAITEKIRKQILEPCGGTDPGTVHYSIKLSENGYIVSIALQKPSSLAAWDVAVMRGIVNAQPFALPPLRDDLRKELLDLRLQFHPGRPLPSCRR